MMAKDRSLRFQRPADVAEALAPFADAKAAHTDALVLHLPQAGEPDAVVAPSAVAEAQGNQPRLGQSIMDQTMPRGAWSRLMALVAHFLGGFGPTPTQPIRRRWRLRFTVMALLGLVALAAVGLWFYSRHILPKASGL